MVTIKVYIEGGGEGKDLDSRFREAWSKFFKSAGLEGKMPRPVRGKGRAHTYDLFKTACNHQTRQELPVLLLDSEDAIISGRTIWQHLQHRDGFQQPQNSSSDQVYLMIQVMETWLIADIESLKNYFGSKFKETKIPAWHDLAAVDKQIILDALDKSTIECGAKKYAKGKISFEVLGNTNAQKVAEKCPEAHRLIDFLKSTH